MSGEPGEDVRLPIEGESVERGLVPFSGAALLDHAPAVVLREAHEAAKALQGVIASKPRPVMMNGQQYLEFEDWQTVGRFYGITVKEDGDPEYIEFPEGTRGFKASAVAIHHGEVISRATGYCLNDEPKWRSRAVYEWLYLTTEGELVAEDPGRDRIVWEPNPGKPGKNRPKKERMKTSEEPVPLFQLASMAQTRACAKVLRNVLSWVVVLAGYRPTPVEELDGVIDGEEAPTRNGAAASGAAAETPGVGDGTAAVREAPTVAPKTAKTVRAAAGGGEVPRTAHNEARSRSSSTAASASPPSDVGTEMSGPPTPDEMNALWALIKKQGLRKKLVSGKWLVEFPAAVSKALGMPPGHVVVGEMTAFQVMRVRETMEAIAFQEPTEVKMVEEPKGAVVFEREPGDEAQFVDDGGARRL